jgi:hypothetical protein
MTGHPPALYALHQFGQGIAADMRQLKNANGVIFNSIKSVVLLDAKHSNGKRIAGNDPTNLRMVHQQVQRVKDPVPIQFRLPCSPSRQRICVDVLDIFERLWAKNEPHS